MELQKQFGANVRQYRRAHGWTQEVLAEQVGVTYETISKIERGVGAPSFETAEKIATALSVAPAVLFGAEAEPPGERGRALAKIHTTLAQMNLEQLARAGDVLKALIGK